MRTITDQEKRTIRLAGGAIIVYLACFFGVTGWGRLSAGRKDYLAMVESARKLKQDIQLYRDKAEKLASLMEKARFDPANLDRAKLVAQASAAIQKAGTGGGLQFGPIRETTGQAAAKELATIQLEGTGQTPAVIAFLHRLGSLGYPIVVDSVQFAPQQNQPGMLKVTLSIIVLDYDQWKKEANSHA
jgi:hypothetical protein